MINFFRRIRRRLADDNQFFKYSRYAIGEVVLVVIGILIALQINNWNEGRKIRIEELKALKDLKNEFKSNHNDLLWIYEEKKSTLLRNRNYIKAIVSDSLSLEHKINLVDPGPSGFNLRANYTILKSLLNSGKLDYFENDSLKYKLSRWPDEIAYYKLYENSHNERAIPNLQSITSKLMPGVIIGRNDGSFFVEPIQSIDIVNQYKKGLIVNLEFQNAIAGIANSLFIKTDILGYLVYQSSVIQNDLDKEIQKRSN